MRTELIQSEEELTKGNEPYLEAVRQGKLDFFDMGCGSGGSIEWLQHAFGMKKGAGIEMRPLRVIEGRKLKRKLIFGNALELDLPEKCVSFTSMMDVLEHLNNIKDTAQLVGSAARLSRDFVFIRHPNFDCINDMKKYGLRAAWTSWTCHRNPIKIKEFEEMLLGLGLNDFNIIPINPILDSGDHWIVPDDCHANTNVYVPNSELARKESVLFRQPLWTHYDIYIRLNPKWSIEKWISITGNSLTKVAQRAIIKRGEGFNC